MSHHVLKSYSSLSDINECRTGNHSCEQKCVNTDGSYHCECESGYELRRRSCRGKLYIDHVLKLLITCRY